MNVLVVHNRYRERGGEDRVVELESRLLERHGHTVVSYVVDNRSIDATPKATLPLLTIWNRHTVNDVRQLISLARADVVHVHNTLPLISPSVYYAARREGVPVVQTLHNYRLFCANAQCVRGGRPCTECLGAALPLAAVRHACYRGSRLATGTVAAMVLMHRAIGTWQGAVDTYIAPTEFARQLFISAGLPAGRLVVKPHFVEPDPGVGGHRGGFALYVGRLSREKGIETLLEAWSLDRSLPPLTIVGDGPLAPMVQDASAHLPITWYGAQPAATVHALMRDAQCLVFPSITFETFGQVVAEAFAAGTAVVASDGGAAKELVADGRSGLLFRNADAVSLAAQVARMAADREARERMGRAARGHYEATFTAAASYRALFDIYSTAMTRSGARFHVGSDSRAA